MIKYDYCLIVHFDMMEEMFSNDFPLHRIIRYCENENIPNIGIAAYTAPNSTYKDSFDAILYPKENGWFDTKFYDLLRDKKLLITGGFKSLCVKELCEMLDKAGCKLYFDDNNPEWLTDSVNYKTIWTPKKDADGRVIINEFNENGVRIYVDGSYDKDRILASWAFCALDEKTGIILKEDSGIDIPLAAVRENRNIAGECQAVIKALEWVKEHKLDKVSIYHDYKGLAKWGEGEWKATKDFTKYYKDYVLTSGIDIDWQHVKGHTGDTWNEYVDKLAYKAVYGKEKK